MSSSRWRSSRANGAGAQRIKNWDTIAAWVLKRLEIPYAFVLTGTSLENRLVELASIVQFVDRHRLGPTWRLLDVHQVRDEVGPVTGYRNLDAIGRTFASVMIRRRKFEALRELPERIDKNVFVPMTRQQMDVARASISVPRLTGTGSAIVGWEGRCDADSRHWPVLGAATDCRMRYSRSKCNASGGFRNAGAVP